jgi:hypothetical protein
MAPTLNHTVDKTRSEKTLVDKGKPAVENLAL